MMLSPLAVAAQRLQLRCGISWDIQEPRWVVVRRPSRQATLKMVSPLPGGNI